MHIFSFLFVSFFSFFFFFQAEDGIRDDLVTGVQTCALPIYLVLLVRGDHDLNEIKAQKLIGNFRFAKDEEIERILNCRPGYIGPVSSVPLSVYADRTVAAMSDFVCGANEADYHFTGVNWGRDLPEPGQIADIRKVVAGYPSPDGKGNLESVRRIEVGHIFQLDTKHSQAMKATFLDEAGNSRLFEMGCYV